MLYNQEYQEPPAMLDTTISDILDLYLDLDLDLEHITKITETELLNEEIKSDEDEKSYLPTPDDEHLSELSLSKSPVTPEAPETALSSESFTPTESASCSQFSTPLGSASGADKISATLNASNILPEGVRTQQTDRNASQIHYVVADITYLNITHIASRLSEYLTNLYHLYCAYQIYLELFENRNNAATKALPLQHHQDLVQLERSRPQMSLVGI
ncbi:hypothetical protein MMC29_005715, partial [Sticta canariensis]|nr:hypothetical protein [Sticta canariensis]